jgi:hypothetical protein
MAIENSRREDINIDESKVVVNCQQQEGAFKANNISIERITNFVHVSFHTMMQFVLQRNVLSFCYNSVLESKVKLKNKQPCKFQRLSILVMVWLTVRNLPLRRSNQSAESKTTSGSSMKI